MAANLHFELVSPERLLFAAEIGMVIVPGSEGDLGVLAGHSNLIAALRPGTVHVFAAANGPATERFFIEGGFVEVNPAGCTLLAERAQPLAEIDRAKAEQEMNDAKEDVADAKSDAERETADAVLAIAQARLHALDAKVY